MRLFLLFLSSVVAFCSFGFDSDRQEASAAVSQLQRFSFQIETSKAFMSGVLLANEDEENIYGSMVNEFGISAIDFSYSKRKQKVKLINVIGFLNKWYIKYVLKNDMKFCIHVLYGTPHKQSNKYEVTRTVDTISILNHKRNIKYTFSPLENQE